MKNCQYCRKDFLNSDFGNICSEECYNKKKQYRENYKDTARKLQLERKFGLRIEEYDRLYDLQNGCCAICQRHQIEFKRRFAVDHDHETSKVRGLLCGNCNTGIGNLRDSIALLKSAILYLKKKIAMPSKSKAQDRFMKAVAHNRGFAKKVGVKQSVGREFSKADQAAGKFGPKKKK